MSELMTAVALSGAVDTAMLLELAKWRLPVAVPDGEEAPYNSPEEAAAAIDDALSGEGQVEMRSTDLDILRQYAENRRKGTLKLVTQKDSGTFPVYFAVSRFGEYLIPVEGDALDDILVNGDSYLLDGGRKVFFQEVKSLYVGDKKVFAACTPTRQL